MADQKKKKKTRKKEKGRRVMSAGFMFSTLLIAVVTFYVCFSIGMDAYDKLPF